MHLTYRYRVKSLQGELNRQARAVNLVWNYCNDAQKHAARRGKRWLSGFELNKLTAGAGRDLGLIAHTVDHIGQRYARCRDQKKRPWLRYRGRKSPGWIPLRSSSVRWGEGGLIFAKKCYRLFGSRQLPAGAKIKDGSSFSQDARGRWYLNLVVEIDTLEPRNAERSVGIDLGLKDLAVLSTGEKIANPRCLQALADRLGKAQRAGKKRQVANIHARIANARRDFLHKLSTRIVREFDYIAVGNVSTAGLAKTSMAKSVLDAGWSSFRFMLAYKSIANGAVFEEVDERLTTQVCSECGCLPDTRPRGIADLGIRQWDCGECGASHDRDVNAARNILARSRHRSPVVGAVAA